MGPGERSLYWRGEHTERGHTHCLDFVDLAVVRLVASVLFVARDFLGWGATIVLYGRDREPGLNIGRRKSRAGLIHTSPSAVSPTAFFFVVLLVVVAVVDLDWRVELRVARVDGDAVSVSSSSPRFLLNDAQHGVDSDRESIPWMP